MRSTCKKRDQNFIDWASTFADVATEQPELARELSALCEKVCARRSAPGP